MTYNSTNGTSFSSWTEPFALRVFRLTVFSAIVLASLFGNSLVLKTVLSLPRNRIPVTYKMVMNLAIAELVNTTMLPFLITYDELSSWVFGQFLCQLISPFQILANSVVTSTLAVIAVCRCLLVFPQSASILQKHRHIVGVILCLWLLSLAMAIPNFIFNTVVKSVQYKTTFWCITLLPGDTPNTFPSLSFQVLVLVQIVLNFLVTSTVMITSYGLVMYKMRHGRTVRAVYRSGNPHDQTETTVDHIELSVQSRESTEEQHEPPEINEAEDGETASFLSMDTDLFRMFYAIILIFICCYFPYQVLFILEYFRIVTRWKYLVVLRKYLFVLTCLPSALHPLCYGLMTKFYAKAFAKIILCK